jgi:TolA-binding protein
MHRDAHCLRQYYEFDIDLLMRLHKQSPVEGFDAFSLQEEQQQKQQTLEQQFADERSRNQELASGFQREQQQRERNEELIRELEHRRDESQDKASQPAVLSFVLLPGVSRSGGALQKLAVPGAARLVRLQIGIEPGDDYRGFGVELRTQGGQHIWSQNRLSPRSGRSGRAVALNLPARLLGAGRYELALKGETAEGKTRTSASTISKC